MRMRGVFVPSPDRDPPPGAAAVGEAAVAAIPSAGWTGTFWSARVESFETRITPTPYGAIVVVEDGPWALAGFDTIARALVERGFSTETAWDPPASPAEWQTFRRARLGAPEVPPLDPILDRASPMAESAGIDAVPLPERCLLVLVTASGLIDNGGVKWFFENFGGPDALRVSEAAAEVGLTEWVTPWQRLAGIVGEEDDTDALLEALDAHRGEVDDLEELICAPDVDDALHRYARARKLIPPARRKR